MRSGAVLVLLFASAVSGAWLSTAVAPPRACRTRAGWARLAAEDDVAVMDDDAIDDGSLESDPMDGEPPAPRLGEVGAGPAGGAVPPADHVRDPPPCGNYFCPDEDSADENILASHVVGYYDFGSVGCGVVIKAADARQ